MPHCESCGTGDVDPSRLNFNPAVGKVECDSCKTEEAPQAAPQPQFEFGLHLTSKEGFRADLSYGELGMSFTATPAQLKQLLKGKNGG